MDKYSINYKPFQEIPITERKIIISLISGAESAANTVMSTITDYNYLRPYLQVLFKLVAENPEFFAAYKGENKLEIAVNYLIAQVSAGTTVPQKIEISNAHLLTTGDGEPLHKGHYWVWDPWMRVVRSLLVDDEALLNLNTMEFTLFSIPLANFFKDYDSAIDLGMNS